MRFGTSLGSRAVSVLVAVTLASSFANVGLATAALADDNTNQSRTSRSAAASFEDEASLQEDVEGVYTVTFVNADGTVLERDAEVAAGSAPSYDGVTPTKGDTAKGSYTFDGWTNAAGAVVDLSKEKVTKDVTYTAHYVVKVSATAEQVVKKLQTRFVLKGDNSDISLATGTQYAAYALYHRGVDLDASSIKKAFKADEKAETDAAVLAQWILTLTAAGEDAVSITMPDGETGMVAHLESLLKEQMDKLTLVDIVTILPVYFSGNYTDGSDVVEPLVQRLLDTVDKTVVKEELAADVLLQAQMLLSLSDKVLTDDQIAAIEDADRQKMYQRVADLVNGEEGLKKSVLSFQQADGGFPSVAPGVVLGDADAATSSDSDVLTTSYVIAALCALDKNASGNLPTKDGNSPVDYLISAADDDLSGYQDYAKSLAVAEGDAELTTAAAALMGLEASLLTVKADNTTNVMEFPIDGKDNGSGKSNTSSTKTAATGDAGAAGVAGAAALGALGAFAFANRRRKTEADA